MTKQCHKTAGRLIMAVALIAPPSVSFAQFTPYLSMAGVTWEDETTFWLDGVRIVGIGLTASDEVSAKYQFRASDASFVLVDSKVAFGAGVVYRDQGFTSVEVTPQAISYRAFGNSYAGDNTNRRFTSTTAAPFVATLSLLPGHVVSHRIGSTNTDFRYEVLDGAGKVVAFFDGLATSSSVISGAYRVTAGGVYTIKVTPRNTTGALSFDFAVMNANYSPIRTVVDGYQVSAQFAANIRDYYKATISLNPGERLTLPTPADGNISMCVLDSFSRQKACVNGLPLSFKATEAGTYYLFVYNIKGWGSGYFGTARIVQEGLSTASSASAQSASSRSGIDRGASAGSSAR